MPNKLNIDKKDIYRLFLQDKTLKEIAGHFNCSICYISKKLTEVFKEKREQVALQRKGKL